MTESNKFLYIKGTTREVCRMCGDQYEDYFFIDTDGQCSDCKVTSSHIGWTNDPKKKEKNKTDELLEKLASLEHRQWIKWSESIMQFLHAPNEKTGKDPSPALIAKRLDEKLQNWILHYWRSYSKLTEKAKDMDRIWAKKVLKIIKDYIAKV